METTNSVDLTILLSDGTDVKLAFDDVPDSVLSGIESRVTTANGNFNDTAQGGGVAIANWFTTDDGEATAVKISEMKVVVQEVTMLS